MELGTQGKNCRLKRNKARLESMMVFQTWAKLKLTFSAYCRWFKGQPSQKKGGLRQSFWDSKASWGMQNYPCPDLGENIGHETCGNSSELSTQMEMNNIRKHCTQKNISQLDSEKLVYVLRGLRDDLTQPHNFSLSVSASVFVWSWCWDKGKSSKGRTTGSTMLQLNYMENQERVWAKPLLTLSA